MAALRASSAARQPVGVDRRHQLIEATLDMLAAKGYANITIADVARSVGVSPALVLLHFKTKDQLLLETQRQLAREYHDHWRQVVDAAGPGAAARLWALTRSEFAEQVCTPRKILAWKAFWAEGHGRSAYFKEFGPRNVEYLRILTECCASIIEEGGYQGYDPRIVARVLDCLSEGLWLELTSTSTPMTVHEARRASLTHLALLFPRHFTPQGPIQKAKP